jgi:simple sugar transport system permease protein
MNLILMVIIAAITAGTPLLLATMGEIIAERSGVINLGLEGLMLVGALAGFTTSHYTGSPVLGMLIAGCAGGIMSSIHAFLVINLRCNQIVSGLAIAILGSGVTSFFGRRMIGQTAKGFNPIISDLDIIVFMSLIMAFVLWIFIRYTLWGLNLSSVGQNPSASDAAGLNVLRIRHAAVIFGGAMAGFGGAYLSLAYTQMWIENMTSGRGWIAIALVIFSVWDPVKALLGAYLFGGVMAATLRIQAIGAQVPVYLLNMAPYVVTIIALIFITAFGKKIGAPKALGLPFSRESQ